ncbi:MAG: hypothetical protein CO167_05700 [Candidatus Marinimicrobia bacterium CG_4_9_14_3_um_filter_48_9]|nr:MAG: hypothetical protein CO167_05700 [Candidatus Marinimicrobia bacterium CG_4_9_14_3_um_filter_48_9]
MIMLRLLVTSLLLFFSSLSAALMQGTVAYTFTDKMAYPTDVATMSDGRVLVVDGVNQEVVIFNTTGQATYLTNREFVRLIGIYIDTEDQIYLTDTGAKAIFIFNKNLSLQTKINLNQDIDPTDVVPVGKDVLYVVNNDGHQVVKIDRSGKELARLGGEGRNRGQFKYPATITSGADKSLYVVDVFNGRIQIIGKDDRFLGQYGEWGVTAGQLFRPKGVAVSSNGQVFVSDSFLGVVQVFYPGNRTPDVLLDQDFKTIHLQNPTGLWLDKNGILWVVESAKNQVLGFKIK